MNLFSSGRVESAELANRLGRERLPIHKKEDAVDELGFEQPMNLRDSEEGFTSARCHRYHKVPFSADDGIFLRRQCNRVGRAAVARRVLALCYAANDARSDHQTSTLQLAPSNSPLPAPPGGSNTFKTRPNH